MLKTRLALWCALFLLVAVAQVPRGRCPADGASVTRIRPALRNMLVINEDNSHFFGTRKPEDMTLEGLNAFVDQYAGSAVTHLFLNANAMRASFRSDVRDAIWDPVAGKEPRIFGRRTASGCSRRAWTRMRSGSLAAARRASRRGCPCA